MLIYNPKNGKFTVTGTATKPRVLHLDEVESKDLIAILGDWIESGELLTGSLARKLALAADIIKTLEDL